jgi:hypothetical protein
LDDRPYRGIDLLHFVYRQFERLLVAYPLELCHSLLEAFTERLKRLQGAR